MVVTIAVVVVEFVNQENVERRRFRLLPESLRQLAKCEIWGMTKPVNSLICNDGCAGNFKGYLSTSTSCLSRFLKEIE